MENIFSNIKERILYLADLKKVSREKFFEQLGMTYGNFKGSNKNRPINSDSLAIILSLYPDVSPSWLLTGEEPILMTATGGINPQTSNTKKPVTMNDEIVLSLIRVIEKQEQDVRYALETQRELVLRIPMNLGERTQKRTANA